MSSRADVRVREQRRSEVSGERGGGERTDQKSRSSFSIILPRYVRKRRLGKGTVTTRHSVTFFYSYIYKSLYASTNNFRRSARRVAGVLRASASRVPGARSRGGTRSSPRDRCPSTARPLLPRGVTVPFSTRIELGPLKVKPRRTLSAPASSEFADARGTTSGETRRSNNSNNNNQ